MTNHVDWGGPNMEYRYTLWRVWDDTLPYIQYIGLNPSTADENTDDPTIRKCVGFANRLTMPDRTPFGGICMTNLFAWRDTKPEDMKRAADPVGPDNDLYLSEVARDAGLIIAAWGNHGTHLGRDTRVQQMIPGMYTLKINEKTGQPGHPLYIRYDTELQEYT